MAFSKPQNQSFFYNSRKLYLAGTFVAFVLTLVFLTLFYQSKMQTNLQAKLILSESTTYNQELLSIQTQTKGVLSELSELLPKHWTVIAQAKTDQNSIIRFFEKLETRMQSNGKFEITTLNFTEGQPESIALGLITSLDNFFAFLQYLESTGLHNAETVYLFNLDNLTFNPPQSTAEELNLSLNLKIHFLNL